MRTAEETRRDLLRSAAESHDRAAEHMRRQVGVALEVGDAEAVAAFTALAEDSERRAEAARREANTCQSRGPGGIRCTRGAVHAHHAHGDVHSRHDGFGEWDTWTDEEMRRRSVA